MGSFAAVGIAEAIGEEAPDAVFPLKERPIVLSLKPLVTLSGVVLQESGLRQLTGLQEVTENAASNAFRLARFGTLALILI